MTGQAAGRGVRRALAGFGLALLAAACSGGAAPQAEGDAWRWELPPGFPTPRVPADNPMSEVKVQLGRRLFYDKRLSLNGTQACAGCHEQARAFTDGRARAVGSTGEAHRRNSQSLANVAFATSLTWANPLVTSLEQQALLPLFGETPVELGFSGQEAVLFERLRSDPDYRRLFREAFPQEREPVSLATLTRALAAFQRTLISGNSPYDRYVFRGEVDAMSESARRGMDLFFSERLECDHCHAGFNFQDAVAHDGTRVTEQPFHNTGLYDEDGLGAYPAQDSGLTELTLQPRDMGRFRAPSLRNVAVTAPYMHDGSIPTLQGVVDHYRIGGRSRLANDNRESPLRSEFVRGFQLTPQEREDLVAFLQALTDTDFLTDPRHSDPFLTAP